MDTKWTTEKTKNSNLGSIPPLFCCVFAKIKLKSQAGFEPGSVGLESGFLTNWRSASKKYRHGQLCPYPTMTFGAVQFFPENPKLEQQKYAHVAG